MLSCYLCLCCCVVLCYCVTVCFVMVIVVRLCFVSGVLFCCVVLRCVAFVLFSVCFVYCWLVWLCCGLVFRGLVWEFVYVFGVRGVVVCRFVARSVFVM